MSGLKFDDYLSNEELAFLTGYKQKHKQCEKLQELGIPYIVGGYRKTPKVSKKIAQEFLDKNFNQKTE